eukprot:760226-Hanusia_phi.AAC.5
MLRTRQETLRVCLIPIYDDEERSKKGAEQFSPLRDVTSLTMLFLFLAEDKAASLADACGGTWGFLSVRMAVGMQDSDQIACSSTTHEVVKSGSAGGHSGPSKSSPTGEREGGAEDERFWVNNSLTYLQEDEANSDSKKVEEEEANYENFQIPWFKVSCIFLAVASDAVALIGPVPFLPALCQDRFELSEAEVGIVVGVLTGAYSLANFATSMFLGHWRWSVFCLLITPAYSCSATSADDGSDVCSWIHPCDIDLILLASAHLWSQDPWTAILSRMMIGALNTNFALSRAAISDLIPPGYMPCHNCTPGVNVPCFLA